MQNQCTQDIETLDRLCRLANREAFAVCGIRNSCILTSAVLRDVLEHLGIPAELMRVEAVSFGTRGAVILGSEGDGTRRRAAAPSMWHGHLAVIAAGRFLLDPTLDQIDGQEPFTSEITDAWLRGEETLWWLDGIPAKRVTGSGQVAETLRYRALPHRGGWKRAPDFRYVTRRRPVVNAVLSAWEG